MIVWATCRVTNLHHKQLITWKRDIIRMQDNWNKKAKSMCEGWAYILQPFKEQLLHHIFELWEFGMAVSSRLLIIKPASLSREFRERGAGAQYSTPSINISSIMDWLIIWAQESHSGTYKQFIQWLLEKQGPRLHRQYGPVAYSIYF